MNQLLANFLKINKMVQSPEEFAYIRATVEKLDVNSTYYWVLVNITWRLIGALEMFITRGKKFL